MSEKHKGYFHAFLAALGFAELFGCKSKTRTAFVGACVGWHVYATYEHFRDSRTNSEK